MDDNSVAELVDDERLLRFGETELPGDARVFKGGQRTGARAAVVPTDEDDVGFRLGNSRRNRPDAHFSDELHANAGPRVGVFEVVN